MTEGKDLLLKVVTQLAETQLIAGSFVTFGAVLGVDRNVDVLLPESIKKNPSVDEVDQYWTEQLRQALEAKKVTVACYCVDMHVATVDHQPITPAVLIYVEQHGAAEYRCYPYSRLSDASVAFQQPTIESTPTRLFDSNLENQPRKRWWSRWR